MEDIQAIQLNPQIDSEYIADIKSSDEALILVSPDNALVRYDSGAYPVKRRAELAQTIVDNKKTLLLDGKDPIAYHNIGTAY